jgi:hypothetical protein
MPPDSLRQVVHLHDVDWLELKGAGQSKTPDLLSCVLLITPLYNNRVLQLPER